LTTRIIFGKEYWSGSSSLCSLLHSPVISFLLQICIYIHKCYLFLNNVFKINKLILNNWPNFYIYFSQNFAGRGGVFFFFSRCSFDDRCIIECGVLMCCLSVVDRG
jgi:hypothetical protein